MPFKTSSKQHCPCSLHTLVCTVKVRVMIRTHKHAGREQSRKTRSGERRSLKFQGETREERWPRKRQRLWRLLRPPRQLASSAWKWACRYLGYRTVAMTLLGCLEDVPLQGSAWPHVWNSVRRTFCHLDWEVQTNLTCEVCQIKRRNKGKCVRISNKCSWTKLKFPSLMFDKLCTFIGHQVNASNFYLAKTAAGLFLFTKISNW